MEIRSVFEDEGKLTSNLRIVFSIINGVIIHLATTLEACQMMVKGVKNKRLVVTTNENGEIQVNVDGSITDKIDKPDNNDEIKISTDNGNSLIVNNSNITIGGISSIRELSKLHQVLTASISDSEEVHPRSDDPRVNSPPISPLREGSLRDFEFDDNKIDPFI